MNEFIKYYTCLNDCVYQTKFKLTMLFLLIKNN